jgi:hypothetical protein
MFRRGLGVVEGSGGQRRDRSLSAASFTPGTNRQAARRQSRWRRPCVARRRGTIDGDTVVVASPDVAHPLAVRYGWDTVYPVCTSTRGASLDGSPFRSDDWRSK